jgi:signal transduction histidine kinase/AraC-like DNA-binding protein/CheY-like chemotaxis protein
MQERLTIGALAGWQEGRKLDTFIGHVFHGIQAAARDQGCNLLLGCDAGWSPGAELGRPAWPMLSPGVDFVPVGPWNTDGLVVITPLLSHEGSRHFHDLTHSGFPIVFAGSGESGASVAADNLGGIRQAMAHLVAHGHRQIAFVAGHRHRVKGDSGRRLHAYRQAVQEWDLSRDPRLVAYGAHSYAGGQQAMAQILNTGAPFTAVLASNDVSAMGAIDLLRERGRSVPQDVAVIGFDDLLEARAQIPPLTTVRFPMFELGYRAVLLLLRLIQDQTNEGPSVRIQTRLVVRESCGCLPGAIIEPTSTSSLEGRGKRDRAGIVPAMAEAAMQGVYHLSRDEVTERCSQLLDAFTSSLEQHDLTIFRRSAQQILGQISSQDKDLEPWQAVVSVLRDWVPELLEGLTLPVTHQRAEEMLHQARVVIGEIAQGQYARNLIHHTQVANQLRSMTTQFFAAQDEADVLNVLEENLPQIGIQHAAVVFYEPDGGDPVAWGVVQNWKSTEHNRRFPSRYFPPTGLYPVGADAQPFSLILLPLLIQDEETGFVAFDASDPRLCGEIVQQLAAALRGVRLYRAVVEADRLKSRFLSMVSHELRTPLNLISGLSELLLQEQKHLEPGRCTVNRDDVERIGASAQYLDGLIRDVLDLAQSEMGQLKLVREPLDLINVLETASVIGAQLAGEKGLSWRTHIPKELPRVLGDRARLQQVLLNLIGNAAKFTERGGITLSATAGTDRVTISVQDTGLGIPVEDQKVIFDEFQQSERTALRGYGGLGLGLAICKRLVEMHDGEIGVCSTGKQNGGSTFYFTLPAIDYLTEPVGTTELVEVMIDHGLLGMGRDGKIERRILIVDDEPAVLDVHARLVETHLPDCRVLRAQNGHEALALIDLERPDLVLLDLMMPGLDGFGVLEAMRAEEVSRDIPVIVLTNRVLTEKDMNRLNGARASVLGKGLFSVVETLDHMQTALNGSRRAGSPTQRIVLKAIVYIHTHYTSAISSDDIASHVGLSGRHLTRCFRQEIGVTPTTYLHRYRLRQAKLLLRAGRKSITEIAMEVGFSSSGYFSRVFRQEAGVSPREYRRAGPSCPKSGKTRPKCARPRADDAVE